MRIKILTTMLLTIVATWVVAQPKLMIDEVIAVVGGKAILLSSVEGQSLQMQADGYHATTESKCRIFEQMLIEKLMLNQAEIDSIEVTEKEVDSELDRRVKMYLRNFGTIEAMEEYFHKDINEIKEEFRDVIREQLVTQQVQAKVVADVTITPSEVQRYFTNLIPDSVPTINSEIEISQIVRTPKVHPDEVKKVKDELEQYRQQVISGEKKFSTLAILYSEDPGSAQNGGELGFMFRGDLVPEFSAVAFGLKEGEVSPLIETEFGYHIIQLIERRGEQINVRHILRKPKIRADDLKSAKQYLDSIATLIRAKNFTFEEAAIKFSDDEATRLNGGLVVNPYTGSSKLNPEELDRTTSYLTRNLKIGELSESFESADEKGKTIYKFIMIKTKSQPHKANMKEDYQKIQDFALSNKQQELMDKWIIEKQQSSYVHIDETFKTCTFNYPNWLK